MEASSLLLFTYLLGVAVSYHYLRTYSVKFSNEWMDRVVSAVPAFSWPIVIVAVIVILLVCIILNKQPKDLFK